MPSLDQIVVWIVVGLLGGSLAGLIITWDRKGFGLLRNLAVGLVGALVGGFIFRMLGLTARARQIRDLVARCCVRGRRIAARAHGTLVLAAVQ